MGLEVNDLFRITQFESQIFENGDCEARCMISYTHVKKPEINHSISQSSCGQIDMVIVKSCKVKKGLFANR